MRPIAFAAALLPAAAVAEPFVRPIPQPQTAEAEIWFVVASLALLVALGAVRWLVARR